MIATTLTASHWTFLLVVVAIVLAMVARRGVTIISIAGILLLAAQSPNAGSGGLNHAIFAVQGVFRAMLLAGTQLFDIILLIAVMLAMLRSLQAQGVDEIMVAPLRRLMIGPRSSFFTLVATMYVAAAFFWPSPAVALIGTVLLPVAARAGLGPLSAAVAVNMAGHGMALSADPVIQAATRISAGAAGVPSQAIFPYTLIFSLIVGFIAIALVSIPVLRGRSELATGAPISGAFSSTVALEPLRNRYGVFLAFLVPMILLGEGALMIWRAIYTPEHAIYGGDATALLGGTAVALLILASFAHEGHRALEGVVDHLTEGFAFAVRIFAPVIPIFAFFLLGDPAHASAILGPGVPGYLLDIGRLVGENIGGNPILLCFGILLVACLCGIDGSGFAGLPLLGALSGAIGGSPHNVAILASIGQVASIWVGGGTVIPWSGVCVAAGVAGISPEALARRNLVPVLVGLIVMTIAAICLFE